MASFLSDNPDRPGRCRRRCATLERVEQKLGHRGAVTAPVSFDRAPAHLIGRRGEGFSYMLVLMNNARLGVGFESTGVGPYALHEENTTSSGRGLASLAANLSNVPRGAGAE